MKCSKKIAAALLMMAVVFGCLHTSILEVQAAPKTTTYVMDSKKGVYYPTKVRAGLNALYSSFDIYMVDNGNYIASVKSSSPNLIAKVTERTSYTGDNYTSVRLGEDKTQKCQSRDTISCHATKKGAYTLTVTINNAKKKKVCQKKIKVYAEEYADPVKSMKYAGKLCEEYGSNLFTKQSGKLQVTMNKGFKLQSIEIGTYPAGAYEDYSIDPVYKKVKNKATISLAKETKYTTGVYSSEYTYSSYQSGTNYDYLYPVTFVRITYKDTTLGIVQSKEYELYYKNK